MDMPLFVVAILFGLLWKRSTWQGAFAGYLAGALAGGLARFGAGYDFNTATFISAGAALLVCPMVSAFTRPEHPEKLESIWKMRYSSPEEEKRGDIYHIIPRSKRGKLFFFLLFLGLALFLGGIIMGSRGHPKAGLAAVTGMVIYFFSGLFRLRYD
jgi:SSS family solute:Na+ symporter